MLKQSHYKVGCDAHKHYSLFAVFDRQGKPVKRTRVNHTPGAIRTFLSRFPPGTPVALETVGNWYWIVDEIEAAGCLPQMAHAARAKMMMGNVHKTDKLDADGLATLLHNGTLPSIWIAPGSLRDERELPRTRMAFSKMRTALKNRMHSTLAKYALSLDTQSDIYAPKWRPQLVQLIRSLPDETRRCMEQELELLGLVQDQINQLEVRILERVHMTPTLQLIQSVPGPAKILAIVIDREVGSIDRFPCPASFASYAGLVPRVRASGGKVHYGRMIKQANNYLKWAFIEGGCPSAAPSGVAVQARGPDLRTHSPTQGPLRGGRRRSKIPRRGDLLDPQEGRALPGAHFQAACTEQVRGLVQAGAGACLTWILRDP